MTKFIHGSTNSSKTRKHKNTKNPQNRQKNWKKSTNSCTNIKWDGLFPRIPLHPTPPPFLQTCFEFLPIFWWILWNVLPDERKSIFHRPECLLLFWRNIFENKVDLLDNLKSKRFWFHLLLALNAHTPLSADLTVHHRVLCRLDSASLITFECWCGPFITY